MSQPKRIFLDKCKIRRGMFEDERVVQIEVKGTTYTTFADREDVEEDGVLLKDNWVNGRIQVYRVEPRGENAFVILPREAFGNGRRLLVPQSLLLGL